MKILLDMDGVSVDFAKGVLGVFNRLDLLENYPLGKQINEALGISDKEFWQIIDNKAPNFWLELEEYPWFSDLYRRLGLIAPVVFCSKPNENSNSVSGKLEWLQKRFGKKFRDYIFVKDKNHCAREGSILVDDTIENLEKFEKAGGLTVCFRQPWNGSKLPIYDSFKVDQAVMLVRAKLKKLKSLNTKKG